MTQMTNDRKIMLKSYKRYLSYNLSDVKRNDYVEFVDLR